MTDAFQMLSVLAPFLSWIKDGSLQTKQKQLWSCCLLEAEPQMLAATIRLCSVQHSASKVSLSHSPNACIWM